MNCHMMQDHQIQVLVTTDRVNRSELDHGPITVHFSIDFHRSVEYRSSGARYDSRSQFASRKNFLSILAE